MIRMDIFRTERRRYVLFRNIGVGIGVGIGVEKIDKGSAVSGKEYGSRDRVKLQKKSSQRQLRKISR
jgi:hypothetical protein